MRKQKSIIYLIILIIFSSYIMYSQQNLTVNDPGWAEWSKSYSDPVLLAKKWIKNTYGFWTFPGYTATKGVYTIGKFFTMYGGSYILLESPSIAYDLVSGGFVKVIKSIGWDGIRALISASIKNPKNISKKIAKQTIKYGLKDYKMAYDIAKEYIRTGSLSEDDAKMFLFYRWGMHKLASARIFYNSLTNGKSISTDMAEKLTEETLKKIKIKWLNKMGITGDLPILEVSRIIKLIVNELELKQIGLTEYHPYVKFREKMDYINNLRMLEWNRFNNKTDKPKETSNKKIVLLIDSSGSMTQNDPRDLRKQAAKMIAELCYIRDQELSILDFDSGFKIISSFKQYLPQVLTNINKIDSDGGTDIGNSISNTLQYLTRKGINNNSVDIVLFTDGKGNYKNEAEEFSKRGWKINTVGLGNSIDEKLLVKIANTSRGKYYKLKNASDIMGFYNKLFSYIGDVSLIVQEKYKIFPKEEKIKTMYIDGGVNDIMYNTTWPGSTIGLKLTDPNGKVYYPSIKGSTYKAGTIKDPAAGIWEIKLTGDDVRSSGEPVELSVEARSKPGYRYSLRGLGNNYLPFDDVNFSVSMPSTYKTVSGELNIVSPSGRVMKKSGRIKNNKVNFYLPPLNNPGNYNLLLKLISEDFNGNEVIRYFNRMVHIGSSKWSRGIGKITEIRGMYLTINLGRADGIRNGQKINIYKNLRSGEKIGIGHIIAVYQERSTMEIFTTSGVAAPGRGMIVKIDKIKWKSNW